MKPEGASEESERLSLDGLTQYVVLDREDGEGLIEEADDGSFNHRDCTRWFAVSDVAPLLKELKARRAAMASRPEWILSACVYCNGLEPGGRWTDVDLRHWPGAQEGHRVDCIYSQYPTETSDE